MAEFSPRERLIDAAFAMFDEAGYDDVTTDAIAQRAKVGRTTLFRLFGSKEGLVFPDHDALLAAVEVSLATPTTGSALEAVVGAARLVLVHYLEEGERARTRWRLTGSVPGLRDRENASVGRYVRIFPATPVRAHVRGGGFSASRGVAGHGRGDRPQPCVAAMVAR